MQKSVSHRWIIHQVVLLFTWKTHHWLDLPTTVTNALSEISSSSVSNSQVYSPSKSTLDTHILTVRLVMESGSEKLSRLNGWPFWNPASLVDLTLELLLRFHSAFWTGSSPRYLQPRYATSPRTAVTLRVISRSGSSSVSETKSNTMFSDNWRSKVHLNSSEITNTSKAEIA